MYIWKKMHKCSWICDNKI